MKLQIIVLHYKEPQSYVERFLDSIKVQDFIDKSEIEVIIINDGNEVLLNKNLFNKYDFSIKYFVKDGSGMSDSRQYGQDHSVADYLMFCDCDDLFLRIDSLYKIIEKINSNSYDLIIGARLQDVNNTIEIVSADSQINKHEIHGKAYRRQFLIEHNINGKTELTAWDEDFYFNKLCLAESPKISLIQEPIYLGKHRKDSITSIENVNKEDLMNRELTLVERYLILLKELKSRNKINYFMKQLCNAMMLLYDINLSYKHYPCIVDRSIELAEKLSNVYLNEILELTRDQIIQEFKILPSNFSIQYNCFDKTFVQWWRDINKNLEHWLEN